MAQALPYQTGSQATYAITSDMATAFNNAVTLMKNTVGTGKVDDLSLSQLAPIIDAYQAAYDAFANGIVGPNNINIDALPDAASTIDGWNTFAAAVNYAAAEADLNISLGYISRILQNLKRSPG